MPSQQEPKWVSSQMQAITHNSLSMLFKIVDQHDTVGIIKLLNTDRVQSLALSQHTVQILSQFRWVQYTKTLFKSAKKCVQMNSSVFHLFN